MLQVSFLKDIRDQAQHTNRWRSYGFLSSFNQTNRGDRILLYMIYNLAAFHNNFLPFHRLSFHFLFVCLFFTTYFAVWKFVSLIRSHWFIFGFISIALRDWPNKTFVWFMSENDLLIFSSRILWHHVLYLNLWAILSLFFIFWSFGGHTHSTWRFPG